MSPCFVQKNHRILSAARMAECLQLRQVGRIGRVVRAGRPRHDEPWIEAVLSQRAVPPAGRGASP